MVGAGTSWRKLMRLVCFRFSHERIFPEPSSRARAKRSHLEWFQNSVVAGPWLGLVGWSTASWTAAGSTAPRRFSWNHEIYETHEKNFGHARLVFLSCILCISWFVSARKRCRRSRFATAFQDLAESAICRLEVCAIRIVQRWKLLDFPLFSTVAVV